MAVFKNKYSAYVFLLIIISTVIRGLLAGFLELGNDEVYYVLYARFPDWSHFDHPLMVGFVIQLFSLDLFFENEFFIRLSSVIFGAINIWLMYQIGKIIKNGRVGFYAVLLYVSSIYATVIAGIFILPDTPQSLFWLLSIYLMIRVLPSDKIDRNTGALMLLLGVTLGFGILSKYTTAFLWVGMGLFFLFFRRDWFKSPYLYLAAIVSFVIASPILIWNFQNDWISFTFHSSRVNSFSQTINIEYFITEIIGEFLYNNPINFILIALTLITYINGRLFIKVAYLQIIILSTLPLIATFLLISLTRSTLPHWSAPSYTTLLLIAAVWIDQWKKPILRRSVFIASLSLLVITLVVGFSQIKFGIFTFDQHDEYQTIGNNDVSLDLFGFDQTGKAFAGIVKRDIHDQTMPSNSILVGDNWFPLANYDYYAASPVGMRSYGIGQLDRIHKYAWINQINGGFEKGMCAYYITDSRYYRPPDNELASYFESVELADTIQIYRNGKIAKRAFVYRLKNMVKIQGDILRESPLPSP